MGDYKQLVAFYLDQVWRRRRIALLFAWAVCCLGWLFVALLPDKYESEARVYVDTKSLLNPLLKGISVRAEDKSEQDVTIMQRTLTARPNLAKVAQLTDLDKSVRTTPELQTLLDRLQERIEVTNQGNNLFRVKYVDNTSSMAKRVVQALLTIFVENNIGDRRADMQGARTFIEAQLAEYEAKLRESENKIADFKIANMSYISSGADFTNRFDSARQAAKQRKEELDDLMGQRDLLKSRLGETPQFLSIDAAPQVQVGEGGPPLQSRIRSLQRKIDDLKLQYTDKHPEIVQAREMLKQLEETQTAENKAQKEGKPSPSNGSRSEVTNEVYSQLSLRLSELDGKITSVRRKMTDAEAELGDLQKKMAESLRVEAEFTALNRDYQVMKTNYDGLLSRRESARIGEAADSSADSVQFRIIAEPEEPAFPTGPKRLLFNVMVFLVGIAGGCGFVVLLAKLEDCVTVPEDLAAFQEYPVLGTISNAVTLVTRAPFTKRHRNFLIGTAALAGVFIVMVAFTPNLSTIPSKIAMRLSS